MPRWRSTSPPEPVAAELPPDAGAVLLPLARAAIGRAFGRDTGPTDPPDWVQAPGASFVTLTTAGALSGCIGSTEPRRALGDDVTGNARAAAFHDPRFAPMAEAELELTTIEVSVLSAQTPLPVVDEADAVARLRVGVDGVVLTYAGRRATFLPQVWETLPDPAVFLARLRVKLGVPATYWSRGMTLSRYTVTAFHEEATR